MPTGRVAFYDRNRGYGFLKPDADEGKDVFVHANHLTNVDALQKDQRVSFEVVNDDRRDRPQAINVRVI